MMTDLVCVCVFVICIHFRDKPKMLCVMIVVLV